MGRSRTQRITTAGGSSRRRRRLSSTSLTCICTGSRCAPQPEPHGGQDIGLCRAGECRATPVASFPNTLTSGGHTFTCGGHTLASGGHTCMCGRHTLTCGGHTLTSGGHTEGWISVCVGLSPTPNPKLQPPAPNLKPQTLKLGTDIGVYFDGNHRAVLVQGLGGTKPS